MISTIQFGLPVARIELLDEVQIDAINRYSKTDLAIAPTLFLEFHGTEQGVEEQSQIVQELAADAGGGNFVDNQHRREKSAMAGAARCGLRV